MTSKHLLVPRLVAPPEAVTKVAGSSARQKTRRTALGQLGPRPRFQRGPNRPACIPGCSAPINPACVSARHTVGSLRPGLVQLVGYVDDLRGLRLRRVDFVGDVLGDESADLTINASQDA